MRLETWESLQRALRNVAIKCIKIETKIHHKKHKRDIIGLIQKPRGHKEDGASFLNQIQYKVSQIHNKSTLKRRTEGGRYRGGGLENRGVHEQITKAAINLTQLKGYLYPRDWSDRYAGPVRPVD